MTAKTHKGILVTSITIFLIIVSFNLFSDGMFMDGLYYSTIGRNMSEGIGSFWSPILTDTFGNPFYGHPPMAFRLQSVLFSIFGDSIQVERFYSLLCFVITAYFLVKIWRFITGKMDYAWLPLILWLICSKVLWAASNNILENTVSMFIYPAIFFMLKATRSGVFLNTLIAGFLVFCAVLSKGFVALYVWAFVFFYALFNEELKIGKSIAMTFLFIFGTLLPLTLVFFLLPDARLFIQNYMNTQILSSMDSVQTVSTRWFIVGEFFKNIAIPVVLSAIVVFLIKRKYESPLNLKYKSALPFFITALCGVIPVMITMKQRSFYISTVYPLFAIGLALILLPVLKQKLDHWEDKKGGVQKLALPLLVLCFMNIGIQMKRVGRDKKMIHDVRLILNELEPHTTIDLCPKLRTRWSLYGYFMRYGYVSLKSNSNENQYYLGMKSCAPDSKIYDEVDLDLQWFRLYKK